jgi:hypothetical protein
MQQNNPKTDMELDAMYNMAAKFMNYTGPKTRKAMSQFANSNPGVAAKMGQYQQAMKGMSRPAQYNVGGDASGGTFVPMPQLPIDVDSSQSTTTEDGSPFSYEKDVVPLFGEAVKKTMDPTKPEVSKVVEDTNQIISDTEGQVSGDVSYTADTAGPAAQATTPTKTTTSTYAADQVAQDVEQTVDDLDTSSYKTSVSTDQLVKAQEQTESSVSGMQAAQGTAYMMNNPAQRQIQNGELISGAADAQKAAQFTEQVQAATASPSAKATVAGQLDSLMKDFDGGQTPVWAAGAMRAATAQMAARGLGSSSLAGQAIIQAAMESAIPIAQADAATVARFESQNLSNRQQRAMLAAEQRAQFMGMEFDQAFQARVMNAAKISDVANMNFTAEQQVALENARATNTMNLANLSNSQAMVMAEAAALANLDMANLSNRQQAAVQNAQAFLETDFRNMDRISQMDTFKTQQKVQALFTDQAAENAARQFNASSENQTNQFFASLESQTSQFNASQKNAMEQFNTNAKNASKQFNADMKNQRQQFNARNSLVIAQANAQWRQNIATLNTAAENEANMEYAKTINNLTSKNLDAVWQRERDLMSYNFTSEESAKNRALELIKADMDLEALRTKIGYNEDAAKTELAFRFLFGSSFGGLFG